MKQFLYILIILLLVQCSVPENKTADNPNILFILVDDQRNDVIGCAGHPIVKTPTVDKLANNGIRFTNAFVTTSICAASRASIFTGLYECKHNYTFGKDPIRQDFIATSYPLLLKESGYRTGFVGKFGVNIEKQDSMINEMFDYFQSSPVNYPHFVEQSDGSKRHSAEVWGDKAIDFIKQNREKPFCLSVSFNSVHAVDQSLEPGIEGHYPYPKAVETLYENIQMPEPDLSEPVIFENHPDFMKNSLNRERYFWRWDSPEKYQVNMRAYFRMISGYDNVIKRILAALKVKGYDKNTVIIYSADNGYYMGNRGFAGKWTHYEESLRVPMIIYDPRSSNAEIGKTIDKPVLNIDIPATILGLAGITIPNVYQGKSFLPLISDNYSESWRESFFCEHRMEHDKIPKYIGIRGQRYVYANYYEQNPPFEYLHDLEKDPSQLKNLATDRDYKDILERLRTEYKEFEAKLAE